METRAADNLLREYAACTDGRAAEALLSRLIVEHAQPAIRRIVRYKLAFQGAMETQDGEDVTAEVLLELIGRLRDLRDCADSAAIGAFSAYTAVAAYYACNEYLRRKYPNRHRLKNRLRYLLNTSSAFEIWEDVTREWVCGRAEWKDAVRPAPREKIAGWRDLLRDLPRGQFALPPAVLAGRIFDAFGAPVAFDDLIEIVADLWGVEDAPPVPEGAAAQVQSGQADVARTLEQRQWLSVLWAEVRELPLPQRVALLLNLRMPAAGSAIALFPATGVAGLPQLAAALGMAEADLLHLWSSLPMDDLAIAARLNVTRQQVINYRKAARERLIRRMNSRGAQSHRANNLLDSTST